MSTEARLARLERRRRAAGEASDQEHLRVGAAIVLARYRGDDTVVAALRARLARLPPPAQGGALDAALRYAAARLGHFDGHPDDQVPELLVACQQPIVAPTGTAVPGVPTAVGRAAMRPQSQARSTL